MLQLCSYKARLIFFVCLGVHMPSIWGLFICQVLLVYVVTNHNKLLTAHQWLGEEEQRSKEVFRKVQQEKLASMRCASNVIRYH